MQPHAHTRCVAHQPTDDDVVNPGVLLELIDTSFEYRNLLVFSIIMLFSSMFACFNSLVIAFFKQLITDCLRGILGTKIPYI